MSKHEYDHNAALLSIDAQLCSLQSMASEMNVNSLVNLALDKALDKSQRLLQGSDADDSDIEDLVVRLTMLEARIYMSPCTYIEQGAPTETFERVLASYFVQ